MDQEEKAAGLEPQRELACSLELVDLELVREGQMDGDLELVYVLYFSDLGFALEYPLSV